MTTWTHHLVPLALVHNSTLECIFSCVWHNTKKSQLTSVFTTCRLHNICGCGKRGAYWLIYKGAAIGHFIMDKLLCGACSGASSSTRYSFESVSGDEGYFQWKTNVFDTDCLEFRFHTVAPRGLRNQTKAWAQPPVWRTTTCGSF